MYKPVSNGCKTTLCNLAFICIDEAGGKIGQAFRLFRRSTRNLSLSQLKGLFSCALRAHKYAVQQRIAIERERKEFNALLEKARKAFI